MTYLIMRFHRDEANKVIERGLSLQEAQEHCQDPETSSRTCTSPAAKEYTEKHGPWFDGYEKE